MFYFISCYVLLSLENLFIIGCIPWTVLRPQPQTITVYRMCSDNKKKKTFYLILQLNFNFAVFDLHLSADVVHLQILFLA